MCNDAGSEVQGHTIDDGVHLDLAEDIVQGCMESASRRVLCSNFSDHGDVEEDKVLCQILGRLRLPETVDDDKVRTLKLLVHNVFTVRSRSRLLDPSLIVMPARQRRPVRDISARNALTKFDTTISKTLSNFSEEEYRQLEQLETSFKFLDDIILSIIDHPPSSVQHGRTTNSELGETYPARASFPLPLPQHRLRLRHR